MGSELQSRLYRIGINAHHWSDLHVGLTSAAIQDERCVAVGISNTGRTEETIQMLRQARSAGATTVALSNNADSPLAEAADLQISTSVYERFLQPDDLSAKHVQLLVIDLIYLLVAQENFPEATAKLTASAIAVSPHRRRNRRPVGNNPESTGPAHARRRPAKVRMTSESLPGPVPNESGTSAAAMPAPAPHSSDERQHHP